jgi:hypothetical protein
VAEVGEDISLVDSDSTAISLVDTTGMRVEWVEMGWLIGSSARNVIAGLPM